eukprot:TRINITY_DN16450_c0_g1_i1.p1 TRINITY_DN16450_c0_g1~~TRINITY_DN16450_c0_g1_i1.p1  ORF type:complete len:2070 (+),score=543.92 TRINITY_DN16450_c0_g1_i1:51-6212(+)
MTDTAAAPRLLSGLQCLGSPLGEHRWTRLPGVSPTRRKQPLPVAPAEPAVVRRLSQRHSPAAGGDCGAPALLEPDKAVRFGSRRKSSTRRAMLFGFSRSAAAAGGTVAGRIGSRVLQRTAVSLMHNDDADDISVATGADDESEGQTTGAEASEIFGITAAAHHTNLQPTPHEQRRIHMERNLRRARPPQPGTPAEPNVLPSRLEREWRMDARSFAVALVQRLGRALGSLEAVFRASPWGLKSHEFVRAVATKVREEEMHPQGVYSPRMPDERRASRMHTRRGSLKQFETDEGYDALQAAVEVYGTVGTDTSRPEGEDRSALARSRDGDLAQEWARLSSRRPSPMHSVDFFRDARVLEWNLAELHGTIDAEDTDRVTWEDFIAFIIDATMQGRHGHEREDKIRSYERADLPGGTPAQLSGLTKAAFSEELDRLVILGNDNRARLVHGDMTHGFRIVQSYPWDSSMGAVMDMDLYTNRPWESGWQLALSTSDATVRVYDAQSTTLRHTIVVPTDTSSTMRVRAGTSQTALRWAPRSRELYCGSRQGRIVALRFRREDSESIADDAPGLHGVARREGIFAKPSFNVAPHTDAIMDLLPLADGCIVSASLDSTICVRNPINVGTGSTLRGHKRGVFSVSHSPQYNFLASVGYEPHPFLWVINVKNFRPFRLRDSDRPHTERLVKVHCVAGTPQLLSMDRGGMLKLWDLRTFGCVQTINCVSEARQPQSAAAEEAEKFSGFLYLDERRSVLTAGGPKSELFLFDYNSLDPLKTPQAADEHPISAVLLLPRRGSVLTAAGKGFKVWRADSGQLEAAHAAVTTDVITCVCTDADERRVYVSSHNGTIVVKDLDRGVLLRRYALHNSEVTVLMYLAGLGCVLTSSRGGSSQMIMDLPEEDGPAGAAKVVQLCGPGVPKVDAASAAYSEEQGVFVTGEHRNAVTVWRCGLAPVEEDVPKELGKAEQADDLVVDWHIPFAWLRKKFGIGKSEAQTGKPGRMQPTWTLIGRCHNVPVDAVCTSVCILDPHPGFCCADSAGGLHVWALDGAPQPLHAAAHWVNHHPEDRRYTPIVRSMRFDAKYRFLYAADDYGHVTITALSQLLVMCCGADSTHFDVIGSVADIRQPKIFSVPRGDSFKRLRNIVQEAVQSLQKRVAERARFGFSSSMVGTEDGDLMRAPAGLAGSAPASPTPAMRHKEEQARRLMSFGRGYEDLITSQQQEQDPVEDVGLSDEVSAIFNFILPARSHQIPPVPTMVCFWKAQDACTSLCFSSSPRMIVTAGSEGRVKMWSMWGRLIGCLVADAEATGPPVDRDEIYMKLLTPAPGSPRTQKARFPVTYGPLAGDLRGLIDWAPRRRGTVAESVLMPPKDDAPTPSSSAASRSSAAAGSEEAGEWAGPSESDTATFGREGLSSEGDADCLYYDDVPPPWGSADAGPIWGLPHVDDATHDVAAPQVHSRSAPRLRSSIAESSVRYTSGIRGVPSVMSEVAASVRRSPSRASPPSTNVRAGSVARFVTWSVGSPRSRDAPGIAVQPLDSDAVSESDGRHEPLSRPARLKIKPARPLIASTSGPRSRPVEHTFGADGGGDLWGIGTELLFLDPVAFLRATLCRTASLAAAASTLSIVCTERLVREEAEMDRAFDDPPPKPHSTLAQSLEALLERRHEVSVRKRLDLHGVRQAGEKELKDYRDWVLSLSKQRKTWREVWRPWDPPPKRTEAVQDYSRPSPRQPDPDPNSLLEHQTRFPKKDLGIEPNQWQLQASDLAYMRPPDSRSLSPGAVLGFPFASPKKKRRQGSPRMPPQPASLPVSAVSSPVKSPPQSPFPRPLPPPALLPPRSPRPALLAVRAAVRMLRLRPAPAPDVVSPPRQQEEAESADAASQPADDEPPAASLAARIWHRTKAASDAPWVGGATAMETLVVRRARDAAPVPKAATYSACAALTLLSATLVQVRPTHPAAIRRRRRTIDASYCSALVVVAWLCAPELCGKLCTRACLRRLRDSCKTRGGRHMYEEMVVMGGYGELLSETPPTPTFIRPLRRPPAAAGSPERRVRLPKRMRRGGGADDYF